MVDNFLVIVCLETQTLLSQIRISFGNRLPEGSVRVVLG